MKKSSKLNPTDKIPGLSDTTIADYWSWAYSDVMTNANRSVLAEFIVASALGVTDRPRVEWDAYDLEYRGKKIEVKCSAYLQSWAQKRPSKIIFDIAKKRTLYTDTNTYSDVPIRPADCYVFCLFKEQDPAKADVLDLDQWKFYVVSTEKIEKKFGDQKTVGLNTIQKICESVNFKKLRSFIDEMV